MFLWIRKEVSWNLQQILIFKFLFQCLSWRWRLKALDMILWLQSLMLVRSSKDRPGRKKWNKILIFSILLKEDSRSTGRRSRQRSNRRSKSKNDDIKNLFTIIHFDYWEWDSLSDFNPYTVSEVVPFYTIRKNAWPLLSPLELKWNKLRFELWLLAWLFELWIH